MSQQNRILEYLKLGNSITPLEALNLFGTLRLGARIFNLQQQGHAIKSEITRLPNGKHVASYRLCPVKNTQINAFKESTNSFSVGCGRDKNGNLIPTLTQGQLFQSNSYTDY